MITDYAGNTVSSSRHRQRPEQRHTPTAPAAPSLNSRHRRQRQRHLNWSAPTSDGGSALTGYRVYRSNTSGAETLLTPSARPPRYTDTGLPTAAPTTTRSARSTPSAKAPSPASAPPLPRPPPAHRPSTPRPPATAQRHLTWTTPTATAAPITGYRVYRSTSSGTETLLATLGTVNSYTDTGLTNGTTYYYKVTALNALGESSPLERALRDPATTAPRRPTLNPATAATARVSLSWNDPEQQRQRRSPATASTAPPGAAPRPARPPSALVNSYTDTGLSNGTPTTTRSPRSTPSARAASPANAPPRRARRPLPARRRSTRPPPATAPSHLSWNAPVRRRQRAHRLPRLPLHQQRRRDPAHHPRHRQQLHRHRPHQRHHLLLQVTALNAVGESGLTNERSATPARPATAPRPDAQPPHRRQRHRRPHLDAPPTATAARRHRLPPLPLHQQRHRNPAHHARPRQQPTPTPASPTAPPTTTSVTALNAARRKQPLQRTLRHTRRPVTTPRRADAQPATAGNGTVALSWNAPAVERRLAHHRLPRLPLHQQRRRDAARHARHRHQLHRHRPHQRHHLLLHRHRRQRRRREHPLQRKLRHTRHDSRRADAPGCPRVGPTQTRPTPPPTTTSSAPSTRSAKAPPRPSAPRIRDDARHAGRRHAGRRNTGHPLLEHARERRQPGRRVQALPLDLERRRDTRRHAQRVQQLHGPRPRQRRDLLLPARRVQRDRRRLAVGRAHRDSGDHAGRAGARGALRRRRLRPPRLDRPSSDGGAPVSGYKIYRGTSSGGETLLTTLDTATGYVDSGLANGTTYYYRVARRTAPARACVDRAQRDARNRSRVRRR